LASKAGSALDFDFAQSAFDASSAACLRLPFSTACRDLGAGVTATLTRGIWPEQCSMLTGSPHDCRPCPSSLAQLLAKLLAQLLAKLLAQLRAADPQTTLS